MANVLDSLVIQLGLDGRGVAQGAKRVEGDLKRVETQAEKTDATFLDLGKTASDSFARARNEALALMAVFTGGRSLKAFVSQTAEANAQLGYMSQRLNMNPQRLWAMQRAVEAMGGSASEVGASINNMQQMLTTPEGAGRLANIMGQLGVRNYTDAQGHLSQDILRRLNVATQGMDQARKNNLLGQLGIGPGEINLIDQTTAAFDKLVASREKIAPTNSEIANGQRLTQDWATFTANADHMARVLFDDVAPALDKVLQFGISLEEHSPHLAEEIAAVTAALVGLGAAAKAITITRGLMMLLGGGAARGGLGLLGRAGIAGAAGAAAWGPTEAGGPVERWLQHHGMDSSATRWFFGDKSTANINPRGNAAQALSILQGMGFSKNAALGIVGNIGQESRFDPGARGDNGKAFGIGQWHQDRVMSILRQTGIDVRTAPFADQVKAYGMELQSGADAGARHAGSILGRNGISVLDATRAVRQYYERPANRDGMEDYKRYQLAQAAAGTTSATAQNNNHTEIHVGSVTVHAPAGSDPHQFAKDFHKELGKTLPYTNAYGQA